MTELKPGVVERMITQINYRKRDERDSIFREDDYSFITTRYVLYIHFLVYICILK